MELTILAIELNLSWKTKLGRFTLENVFAADKLVLVVKVGFMMNKSEGLNCYLTIMRNNYSRSTIQ